MYTTTRGLVLREATYQDSGKILTVLTESEGKLTVSARGAKRKGSRIAAASTLFAYSEMTLSEIRGRWYLNDGNTIELFAGLRTELPALALASYFCELLEAVGDEDNPDPALLRLGLNALYCLSRALYPRRQVKAAFELKLMCLSGYEPMLDGCAACGETEGPFFFSTEGTLRCKDCHTGSEPPLAAGTLSAMRYIVSAELNRAFSFSLAPEAGRQLYQLCERYTEAQLERRFSTLTYYKRMELDHDII